jgi:Mn2+/Fe2+ NRAMP family transporter
VLAGSTAYAVADGRNWPVGLARKPNEGRDGAPIDPIKALYSSAVINGVIAARVMAIPMILVRDPKVMGKFVVKGGPYRLGWLSTAAMALSVVGVAVGWSLG